MRWIVLAAALVALSGCASGSSIVTGRQRPEISISSVVLYSQPPPVYETVGLVEATSVIGATKQQDMDMAVTATMPNGEFFKGSYVMVETRATTSKATNVFATKSFSDDQFNAVLFSDRNNSMRCLFHGDILHGIGTCEISDGRRVDLQW